VEEHERWPAPHAFIGDLESVDLDHLHGTTPRRFRRASFAEIKWNPDPSSAAGADAPALCEAQERALTARSAGYIGGADLLWGTADTRWEGGPVPVISVESTNRT
jgi:hypothetical protein